MSKATDKAEERRKRIFTFMKDQIAAQGYAPTVREVCEALGIRSTSTVHQDIKMLVAQGLLRKDPAKPRAIALDQPLPKTDANRDACEIIEETVAIPIVGAIAAGRPILAEENIEDAFPMPARYIRGTDYILKVRGDSMINAGIMDGDMILVEQTPTAENGEIVVAMIDGFESEATVKRYYREKDYVRLQPENDTMNPIIVRDLRILGRVRGVLRFYR